MIYQRQKVLNTALVLDAVSVAKSFYAGAVVIAYTATATTYLHHPIFMQ